MKNRRARTQCAPQGRSSEKRGGATLCSQSRLSHRQLGFINAPADHGPNMRWRGCPGFRALSEYRRKLGIG